MSRKQLLPVPEVKKQETLTRSSKSNTATAIEQYDETINRIWNMYQEQLNRNVELMAIINRQQEMFGKSLLPAPENSALPASLPAIPHQQLPAKPIEEKPNDLEPLSFAKLRKYTEYFCELYFNPYRRMDALHNMLQLLYNLYQMNGQADKEDLFTKSGVADVTGFRIISKLKQIYFIRSAGTKFNSHYQLTDKGRQFIDFTLTHEAALVNVPQTSSMYRSLSQSYLD